MAKQIKTQRQRNIKAQQKNDKKVVPKKEVEIETIENTLLIKEVENLDKEKVKRKGTIRDFVEVENKKAKEKRSEIQPDDRFPDIGKEEKPKDDKVDFDKFKERNKKENRLKKYYILRSKIKEKLGIIPRESAEPTIVSGIVYKILQFMDFALNSVIIVSITIAVYFGLIAIKNQISPYHIAVICLFIVVLSYVSDRIRG